MGDNYANMPEAAVLNENNPQLTASQQTKRKAPSTSNVAHFTTRNPAWTYLKLQLIHQPGTPTAIQNQPLDALTARTYLNSAFSQFLGLSGTAISVDILKIESTPPENIGASVKQLLWIRVPRQDARAVVTALSSWVGGDRSGQDTGSVAWKVCAKGNFLGALVAGSGGDLFVPS